jgi:hypothetical protein
MNKNAVASDLVFREFLTTRCSLQFHKPNLARAKCGTKARLNAERGIYRRIPNILRRP